MTAGANSRRDAVDQVAFGFARTNSGREMGVVASSLPPGSDQLGMWHERLKPHYRLKTDPTSILPGHALSYLEFGDGTAAVLRRCGAGIRSRNFAHALVGPARSMSSLSLYLDGWPGWLAQAPAGPLTPVGLADLVAVQRATLGRLDLDSLDLARWVVPLVRAVVADPEGRFSVLGAAQDAALPLIRLLRRVVGPMLDGATPAFPWTYSSYELRDDGGRPDLPALLFLACRPPALPGDRFRVVLDEPLDPGDPDTRLAHALVDDYVGSHRAGARDGYVVRVRSHVRRVRKAVERVERVRSIWVAPPADAGDPVDASRRRSSAAPPSRSDPVGIATAGQELQGWDAFGNPKTWTLSTVSPFEVRGSGLATRLVTLGSGSELLLRGCPAMLDPRRRRRVERLLDNEIRAAVRLVRRYAPVGESSAFPPELVELDGYNFDAAEPFAVLARYRGSPAADLLPRLIGAKKQAFAASLFTAVAQLAAADLVHGAITPETLFAGGMDDPGGPFVQIISFEQAVAAGERRWTGEGTAHPGDDVLAAGRLLAIAFADAPPDFTGAPSLHGVDWLEGALQGVFTPDPGDRPTALEVLGRFSARNGVRPIRDRGEELDAGRRRFDELRGKAITPQHPPARSHGAEAASAARRSPSTGGSAVFIVVLVVILVVTVLLVLLGIQE